MLPLMGLVHEDVQEERGAHSPSPVDRPIRRSHMSCAAVCAWQVGAMRMPLLVAPKLMVRRGTCAAPSMISV